MESMDVTIQIDRNRQINQYAEQDENSGERNNHPQPNNNNHTAPVVNIGKYWLTLNEAANNVADFLEVLDLVSQETELDQTMILTTVGPSEDTLLHVAARHGNAELVELIVRKVPCLLRKKGFKGETVWHIAAKTGKVFDKLLNLRNYFKSVLEYSNHRLIRMNVTWDDLSLREMNEEGNTALHEALINRHRHIAHQLFEADQVASFYVNNENKTAVYLAAEAGYAEVLVSMLEYAATGVYKNGVLRGKSIVHAAIMGKHKDVLALILDGNDWFNENVYEEGMTSLIYFRETKDEEGMNPLHWAASIGFLEGIPCLLLNQINSMEWDKKGLTPIHWAAMNGHVDVVEKLFQNNKYSNSVVSRDGRNILHVAAESGRYNVVSYILKTPELGGLINKSDGQKNTPLHLATIHWHPKVVSALTWDKRVDLSSINEEGLAALDAAVFNMKGISSIRQWLTWQVLKAAGAPRAISGIALNAKRKASMKSKSTSSTNYKVMVKALFVVSFIVAVVSFQAGSTKLADYNNFDTDLGIKTILRRIKNHLFVFCNTVAMCSSLINVGILIWAHLGDDNSAFTALQVAKPLLGMALMMAISALVTGVYIVGSKVFWLADAVLTTCMVFLVFFVTLFLPICLPLPSGYQILRYITYFPIRMMIWYICDHLDE